MIQVDTRRLIEAAEESIQQEAPDVLEHGLGLTGPAIKEGFYGTDIWDAFFEDLRDPVSAADTFDMEELQVSFDI